MKTSLLDDMKTGTIGQTTGRTESAAHLLSMMVSAGLRIAAPEHASLLVALVANALASAARSPPRSHADAATAVLNYCADIKLIDIPPRDRSRVVAILGTAIGNAGIKIKR